MTTSRRNIIELREIREDVQDLPELQKAVNDAIVELNYILRSLTLVNLDGDIRTVTIPANSTLRVSHKLGIKPKYRIILKQEGGGLITDGAYTNKYIELINNGGSEATIAVIIVKD